MERRLAAILAADVVGYSLLMGKDETGTLAELQRHREELFEPKAAQHNGRIVKLMGDGTLMEFASVVDAVTFAVDIQTAMRQRNAAIPEDRQITFRVGVNLGDIVHKDDDIYGDGVNVAARLEALAEPGGICISRSARDQVRDKLDLNIEDEGEIEVKNIVRPVRVFRILVDDKAAALASPVQLPAASTNRYWKPVYAVVAALVLVIAASLAWWQYRLSPGDPGFQESATSISKEKPSIAVLPFTNMGGDPQQEYFADGVTEDLITDISKISGLFVIARNSTFAYKNRSIDVRDVARDLGVRYVLEGSVRRAGNQVRINAQLIDAPSGGHIWAERYDGAIADVFALQDKVTRQIVSALAVTLTPGEEKSLSEAARVDPEAYDLYLKGQSRVSVYSPQSNTEARDFFERAVAQDPSFGRAHAGLALTHAVDATFGWSEDAARARDQAVKHARTALALNSTAPQIYLSLAQVYGSQRKLAEGIEELKRAIALDPNFADGYVLMGIFLAYSGKPEPGIAAIRKAMQLSPRHGYIYPYGLSIAYFVMQRYDQAIPIIESVLQRNRNFQQGRLLLISILGLLNRIDDAEWEVSEVLTALPDFSIAAEAGRVRFARPEDLARYVEGLRKAGLPE